MRNYHFMCPWALKDGGNKEYIAITDVYSRDRKIDYPLSISHEKDYIVVIAMTFPIPDRINCTIRIISTTT